MDDRSSTEYEELVISKMKEGGFLVRHPGYAGRMTVELFASSDIGDALNFVRGKLIGAPPVAQLNPAVLLSGQGMGVNQSSSLNPNFRR